MAALEGGPALHAEMGREGLEPSPQSVMSRPLCL